MRHSVSVCTLALGLRRGDWPRSFPVHPSHTLPTVHPFICELMHSAVELAAVLEIVQSIPQHIRKMTLVKVFE